MSTGGNQWRRDPKRSKARRRRAIKYDRKRKETTFQMQRERRERGEE